MKKSLTKLFLTVLVLILSIRLESFSIKYISSHDGLISSLSLIASFLIVILTIYLFYLIFYTEKNKQ